jgi:hypothetical protein
MITEKDDFINLKRETEKAIAQEAPSESHGPSFYVHDKDLPISDEDIGKTMTAVIKVKPVSVSRNVRDNKSTISFDFEIQAIKFK